MESVNNWKEIFSQKLGTSDTKEIDIDGAQALKMSNLPQYLYKYRPVNDFSISNLESDTVYLNAPEEYNDPFEFGEFIDSEKTTLALNRIHQKDFIGVMTSQLSFPEDIITKALESNDALRFLTEYYLKEVEKKDHSEVQKFLDYLTSSMKNRVDESVRNKIKDLQSKMKVCSFCESKDNLLMWSHYTYNHTGFCIEYDIKRWPINDIRKRMLFPVTYNKNIYDATEHIISSITQGTFNNLYPLVSGSVKSKEWEYEQEWRLIFNIGDSFEKQDYRMNCQSRVYLGCRILSDHKQKILEICKRKGLEVYSSSPALENYSLKFEKIDLK